VATQQSAPALMHSGDQAAITADALEALPLAIIVVDPSDHVAYANPTAQSLLRTSLVSLQAHGLHTVLANDSPVIEILNRVRRQGRAVVEHGVALDLPGQADQFNVDIQAAPTELPAHSVVLALHERTIAAQLDTQVTRRRAGRSVAAMAGTLAHEVRNPLSGIRGAAQLLEATASLDDASLLRMIREETDRIGNLIDRMEVFGDSVPITTTPLNIHRILDHVCTVAASGFAKGVTIDRRFDPSLPPVMGHRDALVQVFLNLLKNAAEASPDQAAEIIITTRYETGLSMTEGLGQSRTRLPIVVSIQDNGAGIPDDVLPHLFDPFITTKSYGTGLGLALVAKTVADHAGMIDVESKPRRTIFRVRLPSEPSASTDDRGA